MKKESRKAKKFVSLAGWIRMQMITGHLQPGDRMYSENELCEMFSISRQTVRNAIAQLKEEGLLYQIRGSGTYVSDNAMMIHELIQTEPSEDPWEAMGVENGTGRRLRTHKVAIISTYIDNYIFPATIQSMVRDLGDAGYTSQIAFTENQVLQERKILEQILQKDEVDGIIAEATKSGLPNPNLDLYQECCRRGIALIFFNCAYDELNAPLIALDDENVGYRAAKYLIDMGHRLIGIVMKADDGQGRLRYSGYMKAMMEANLPIDDGAILWISTGDEWKMEEVYMDLGQRLSGATAIFCYNDQVAYSIMKVLQKKGKRIPEDVSLIGIDGYEYPAMPEPRITTIPHPKGELGSKCAESMIQLLADSEYEAGYLYDPEIAVYDSVERRD